MCNQLRQLFVISLIIKFAKRINYFHQNNGILFSTFVVLTICLALRFKIIFVLLNFIFWTLWASQAHMLSRTYGQKILIFYTWRCVEYVRLCRKLVHSFSHHAVRASPVLGRTVTLHTVLRLHKTDAHFYMKLFGINNGHKFTIFLK